MDLGPMGVIMVVKSIIMISLIMSIMLLADAVHCAISLFS
jgi:hypothetical protein